jgi:hypothetical protein
LNSLLERLWAAPKYQRQRRQPASSAPSSLPGIPAIFHAPRKPASARSVNAAQTLGVLRDFSSILTHSLDAEAMLKQFLLFLREIFSVNRAAIFLNRPVRRSARRCPGENRRLRARRHRLSSGLLEHFELSLDAGIGGQLSGWAASCAATATRRAPMPRRRRNLNCSARRSPCPSSTAKTLWASPFSTAASPANRWSTSSWS